MSGRSLTADTPQTWAPLRWTLRPCSSRTGILRTFLLTKFTSHFEEQRSLKLNVNQSNEVIILDINS